MSTLQLLAWISAALALQLVAGIGVSVWRWRTVGAEAPVGAVAPAPAATTGAWPGWREFRVVAREFEDAARTQCSFHLAPVDGLPLPTFRPGQYLTFSLTFGPGVASGNAAAPSAERTLTRCYSLSDRPQPDSYRVTIKRVPAPPGRADLPPDASSSHFHDRVQVGDVLRVKAPGGRFFIDADSELPVVLIAGGIGITPMMSMLLWCVAEQPRRTLHLYHGIRRGEEQAFRQTLETLAATHSNFHLHVACSDAEPNEVLGHAGWHAGRVDVDLLRSSLPHGRHQFYVCGPPAMMASLVPALGLWGVAAGDIHFESFGPA